MLGEEFLMASLSNPHLNFQKYLDSRAGTVTLMVIFCSYFFHGIELRIYFFQIRYKDEFRVLWWSLQLIDTLLVHIDTGNAATSVL